MLEKELAELFGLCQKAIKETDSYVCFEMFNSTKFSSGINYCISIRRSQEDTNGKTFCILDCEEYREMSSEDCKDAKEYLTRLLKENGS